MKYPNKILKDLGYKRISREKSYVTYMHPDGNKVSGRNATHVSYMEGYISRDDFRQLLDYYRFRGEALLAMVDILESQII